MQGSDVLQNVLSRLSGTRRSGDGFVALCPAHDDRRQSLSLSDGDLGVMATCHAGCSIDAIAESIGIEIKDLFYESAPAAQKNTVVAQYEYRDEHGELRYVVERRLPKDFRQRRPDGAGGWIWNLKGVEPLPYRLPEILAADLLEPVLIVEGEKDVDALWSRGFVATCNSGGAGKWRRDLGSYLSGRRVIVLPDNDEPGHKHADVVVQSLTGVAESIDVLDLPGLPKKGDVSDFFALGKTADDLRALLSPSPLLAPHEDVFVIAADEDEPPAQRWIVDGWVPEGFVTTLYAHGGSSKSFLAQFWAMSIALGLPIFKHGVIKGPVLFLDGELDKHSWLRRGYMLARGLNIDRIPRGVFYRRVSRSLLEPQFRKEIVSFLQQERPVLTIIDSFTACLPGNDTNSLDDVTNRIRTLSELGTVLLIDHSAKGSDMTGTATAIGSVAKMMFARSALQIASSPAGGSVLRHTKTNFGPLSDPVAYTLNFGGNMVCVDQIDYTDERLEGIEQALPARARILAAFLAGEFPLGGTARDIAEALDMPPKTAKNSLSQLRRQGHLRLNGKVWISEVGSVNKTSNRPESVPSGQSGQLWNEASQGPGRTPKTERTA